MTVWDEPSVSVATPGHGGKVSGRLCEDERTWLGIKDEQTEAKRMELKEGLEEYSDSEDETRPLVTEGLSDDEGGWSSASSGEEDEQTWPRNSATTSPSSPKVPVSLFTRGKRTT